MTDREKIIKLYDELEKGTENNFIMYDLHGRCYNVIGFRYNCFAYQSIDNATVKYITIDMLSFEKPKTAYDDFLTLSEYDAYYQDEKKIAEYYKNWALKYKTELQGIRIKRNG